VQYLLPLPRECMIEDSVKKTLMPFPTKGDHTTLKINEEVFFFNKFLFSLSKLFWWAALSWSYYWIVLNFWWQLFELSFDFLEKICVTLLSRNFKLTNRSYFLLMFCIMYVRKVDNIFWVFEFADEKGPHSILQFDKRVRKRKWTNCTPTMVGQKLMETWWSRICFDR